MAFKRCPGSTAFAQPKIEIVRCLHCGGDAEVWSDEAEGVCPECGQTVIRTNPNGFVKQVCELIAPPLSGLTENANFRVIHDARLLADRRAGLERPYAGAMGDAGLQDFLTPAGQRIAQTDLFP